jgi:hypothetical protein
MEKIKNTNWSSPKTNIVAGLLDLRKALAGGYKAKLIRANNEDCEHPIKVKQQDSDFRNYEHSIGYASSITKIKEDPNRGEFEKYLTLNYVSVFGSDEAMKRYYETGVIGADNLKNMGRNHLVKVDDLIAYYRSIRDDRANLYERQYRAPEHVNDTSHFFDFFRYKHGSPYAVKEFKRKLWVVQLQGKEENGKLPAVIKVLNFLMYPLKYIPQRSVLRMPEYKLVSYRVGAVVNGFKVEFQIPKKFSFK